MQLFWVKLMNMSINPTTEIAGISSSVLFKKALKLRCNERWK